jgi:nucleotide-binding universal stress UspA family protein
MNTGTTTLPPLGTVVCAVDDSPAGRAVLYAAAGFANHPLSRLVVLRIDPRAAGEEAAVIAARADLQQMVVETLPGDIAYREATELVVRAGDVASTILAVAKEEDATLLVTGTRARGTVGRALFGSTTQSILEQATIPVLVVPPTADDVFTLGSTGVPHFGVIVVALDLGTRAARQMHVAARLSGASNHRLLLVHVAAPGSDHAHAEEQMAALARTAGSAHGERMVVKEGPVAETIAAVARKVGSGLIILGRDRTAAGSIACDLVRQTAALVVVA